MIGWLIYPLPPPTTPCALSGGGGRYNFNKGVSPTNGLVGAKRNTYDIDVDIAINYDVVLSHKYNSICTVYSQITLCKN